MDNVQHWKGHLAMNRATQFASGAARKISMR